MSLSPLAEKSKAGETFHWLIDRDKGFVNCCWNLSWSKNLEAQVEELPGDYRLERTEKRKEVWNGSHPRHPTPRVKRTTFSRSRSG